MVIEFKADHIRSMIILTTYIVTLCFAVALHAQSDDHELTIEPQATFKKDIEPALIQDSSPFSTDSDYSLSPTDIKAFTKFYEENNKQHKFDKRLGRKYKSVPRKLSKKEKRYAVYIRSQRKNPRSFIDWNEPYLQPEAPLKLDIKKQ